MQGLVLLPQNNFYISYFDQSNFEFSNRNIPKTILKEIFSKPFWTKLGSLETLFNMLTNNQKLFPKFEANQTLELKLKCDA
jgi:hypothetical protein